MKSKVEGGEALHLRWFDGQSALPVFGKIVSDGDIFCLMVRMKKKKTRMNKKMIRITEMKMGRIGMKLVTYQWTKYQVCSR